MSSSSSLQKDFFTFLYPSREPKLVSKFLEVRPDIKSLYIYDISLTTGTLLYSCAGGIGVTKERYIVDVHKALKAGTFVPTLSGVISSCHTRWRYLRLRERFNKTHSLDLSLSLSSSTNLYALWALSSFRHKYRGRAYDAIYTPKPIPYTKLTSAKEISNRKNILFRKEDFFSFSESIINENVVIYAHLPSSYGKYGVDWQWSKNEEERTLAVVRELSSFGYKVCISATELKLGIKFADYSPSLPGFKRVVVSEFKGNKFVANFADTETYYLNF